MNERTSLLLKIALSVLLLCVAGLRFIFFDTMGDRIDETFIILMFLSAIIIFLPWERLTSIKAGGIEFILDHPEVKGAFEGLTMSRFDNKQLQKKLMSWKEEVLQVRGSRILWIDDKPHNVLGERRVLRALGAEITTATSSEEADELLRKDNDFDLIITDVQRIGESYKFNQGIPVHEGVNHIVKLKQTSKDPIIKQIPVVFYAAYDNERLKKFTLPATKIDPKIEISNSFVDMLEKVISVLSEVRSHPIKVKTKDKRPTRAG